MRSKLPLVLTRRAAIPVVKSTAPGAPSPVVIHRRSALRGYSPGGHRTQMVSLPKPRATKAEVLQPMPRRVPMLSEGPEFNSPREARYQHEITERVQFIFVRRLFAWSWAFLKFFVNNTFDVVTGKWTAKRRASRLRALFEGLGTTAIKIGQLFSVNSHIVAVEYTDEMDKLFDSVPPMPTEEAIAIIEETRGRPLRELFAKFDPVPIAGGAIATVFQGVLISGEKVAVKVRRPGIERSYRADFQVLLFLHGLGEFLGLVRGRETGAILVECQRMLADEMDLRLEARQIEVFRNATKKLRKKENDDLEFVTAPQVFPAFTCPQVLVTEFVQGISMREILNALQKNNREHLTRLALLGYDFEHLSKQLLHLLYWQTFEAMVFHADLHPANIIVTHDQRLVLVDFGCCGTIPPKYRRNIYGFMKSVEAGDLAGVVRNVVGLSEPLPPIDVKKFMFDMTSVMRDYLVGAHSQHVPWQEKCNLNAFRQSMELGKRYEVPLRPELLRYFRSVRHMDFMVHRLNPHVDTSKQFRKYFERRTKSSGKSARKTLKATFALLCDNLLLDGDTLARSALVGVSRLQDLADSGGFEFGSALKKLPYVFSTITTMLLRCVVVVALIAGARTLHWELTRPEDHVADFWDHATSVSHIDTIEIVLAFFVFIALVKIVSRLRQADIDEK